EYEVTSDDDPDREARPDGQRWRDLQLALDDLLPGLVDGVLRAITDGTDQAVLVVGRQLRADAEQRGQACGLHQIPPVVVHPVLKSGIAGSVRTGQTLEDDGAATRQNQAIPHQEHAALTENHAVIILANDARPLRDQ